MSKVELHTTIDEVVRSKDVNGFELKKIDLGGKKYETPLKSIYISNKVPPPVRLSPSLYNVPYETNRVIWKSQQYESIEKAIREGNEQRIREILWTTEKLARTNLSCVLSFSKFPMIEFERRRFDEFLDFVHAFSRLLFVPNVRYSKHQKSAMEYDAKQFIDHVDFSVQSFHELNSKPIFVPLDIDLPQDISGRILLHYKDKGYTNIWVDAKGKDLSSKASIAKLRTLSKNIKRTLPESLIYVTNMRNIPRDDEDALAPSDFLPVFMYADFIGAPFKGVMGFPPKVKSYAEKTEKPKVKRDASLFDSSTYYYLLPDKIELKDENLDNARIRILNLKDDFKSRYSSYHVNSILLSEEIKHLKGIVNENQNIIPYIREKRFFKEEPEIFKKLIGTEKPLSLF